MPAAILGPVLGSVAGGLVGRSGSKGGQTQSKAPWEPARPWLEDNIDTGQDLQRFYQQNPFNRQQQDAYNNIFADQSNFRGNIAPGMMDFANRLMGTNYQRAPNMFERRPGGMSGGLLGGGNASPMGYGGQPMGGGQAQPMGYEPACVNHRRGHSRCHREEVAAVNHPAVASTSTRKTLLLPI
jgi:hypothetical protein